MRTARVGDVDVLAARAARPVRVDAEVLVVDLDVFVFVELGPDVDRGERGVAARRLIERRDAHQPMHAGFGGHQPEGVLALERERHALQAGFFAGLVVDHLALEAAPLGPFADTCAAASRPSPATRCRPRPDES